MVRRVLAPLLSVAILALATTAAVDGDPIGGIGVSVENSPGGIVVANTKADAKGVA